MENKDENKLKSNTIKKSNNIEKIDVKINKNSIDESKEKNIKKKCKLEIEVDNKKIKNKDDNIIFIVVEKNGSLKETEIKEKLISADELSKKCKFKKVDGFIKRTEWNYSSKSSENSSSSKIVIELWAKNDGFANHENKYEFPPTVDNELFFGCCALVARDTKNNYVNLSKEKWNKIYEYLFGGFESLVGNEDDDDDEEDELDSIPKNRKTRDGYLKDGFVVDSGAGGDSDIEGVGNDDSDDSDESDDSDDDSDISSINSNDGDCEVEGDDGVEDECFNRKNKTSLVKNKLNKNKPKGKNIVKDDDDDYNSGWKTDESSELSEEEYSYSK